VKVLVTGATGFIGRRLCEALAGRGIEVRAVYRRQPGAPVQGTEWWHVRQFDDVAEMTGALSGVECAIHLAGLAHQIGSAAEGRWQEFFHTNVTLTRVLAHSCKRVGVQRLLFISSIAATRSAEDAPVTTAMSPAPESDYGRSKLQAESALQEELRDSPVDWCILRPPVVYGPGNPGNMERLLRLVRKGLPLPIDGIRNRRSFMYIDNLVDAILRVCEYRGQIRTTWMIGDDTQLSTPELVRALAIAANLRPRIFWVPVWVLRVLGRLADVAGRVTGRSLPFDTYSVSKLTESLAVDSTEFRRHFAWQPPVPVDQALRMTSEQIQSRGSS
jgi:nucleoside-diphosphate-sugar epimerase